MSLISKLTEGLKLLCTGGIPQVYKISEVDGLVDIFRFGVPVGGHWHVQGSLPQERLTVRRHIRQVVHHYEHLHYRLIRVEQRLKDKLSGTYFYPTWHVNKVYKLT